MMKTLETVPRGSLLFAMLYNTCPSEELGTTYDDEGLPHVLRRYHLDLHCVHADILAQGVYSDDYPSFGMSPLYYNILSAEIVNSDGIRTNLAKPFLYETLKVTWDLMDTMEALSDPDGSM